MLLPILLFLATVCLSTFWVGCTGWEPVEHTYLGSYAAMWRTIRIIGRSACSTWSLVLAILLTHEMGHFLQTVKNRIAASYPLCIPVPFNAIGTMGAVIGMDGMKANRRQIFDIGIAGPARRLSRRRASVVVGYHRSGFKWSAPPRDLQLHLPWIGQWMLEQAHPEWADRDWIGLSEVNPYFMAGWVGMLITGLNMLPISQLDGGHTTYALFLHGAHTLSRWFISLTIFYIVVNLRASRHVDPDGGTRDPDGDSPSRDCQRQRQAWPRALGHRSRLAGNPAHLLPNLGISPVEEGKGDAANTVRHDICATKSR